MIEHPLPQGGKKFVMSKKLSIVEARDAVIYSCRKNVYTSNSASLNAKVLDTN